MVNLRHDGTITPLFKTQIHNIWKKNIFRPKKELTFCPFLLLHFHIILYNRPPPCETRQTQERKEKERNRYISYDYFIPWINKKYSKILIPHPLPFKEFAIRPTLYRFYFYNCFMIAQTVDLKEFKHDVQQKKIGIYYNHMCKWVSKWKH